MSENRLKPIPKNIVESEQQNMTPYLGSKPDSNEGTVFSHNRAEDISRKNDNIKDVSVGLEDIDNAILYYFENIIKPHVVQNNNLIPVPIIYGSPERWDSVQKGGFYRDKNGKLMVPLIMYKRTNVEKNRAIGNKLDGNKAHNFQLFETKYNSKNQYDNFSVLLNRIPSKQYYLTIVPDYVVITYDCVLFTDYVEQNNKLIEMVEFASDSYWGDPKRWHFRTKIDNFTVTNIVEQGDDKAVKTNFTLVSNGYLIPDSVNKSVASKNMFYSPCQIVFKEEIIK